MAAHIRRAFNADSFSGSSIATSSPTDFTGADFIDVAIQWQGGVTISNVQDTAGNVYTQFGTTLTVGSNNSAHYRTYGIVGTTGQVHTVTFSAPTTYRVVVAHGFSGVQSSSSPDDQNLKNNGSSTAIDSGSFTISGTEIIVALMEADADTISNATYNVTNFNATGDPAAYFADGWHIVSANESASATCASGGWYINAASYKAAVAAAGILDWLGSHPDQLVQHTKISMIPSDVGTGR